MLRLFNMSYYFRIRKFILKKLKHTAPVVLKRLFEEINDPELYALALLDVDGYQQRKNMLASRK